MSSSGSPLIRILNSVSYYAYRLIACGWNEPYRSSLVGHDIHEEVRLVAAVASRNRTTDGELGFIGANEPSHEAALPEHRYAGTDGRVVGVAGREVDHEIVIGQRRERDFRRIESHDARIKIRNFLHRAH